MLPRLDRQNSTTDGRQREWMLHSAWVHMSADEGTVTKFDTKGACVDSGFLVFV